MNKLTEYLEQYALTSLEKQDKLALLLGDYTYLLDLDAGRIRFNDNFEFSFQVLGTESDNTLIWLWAWADEQTDEVPGDLLKASRDLRDWGLREGVQEFTRPSVDLDKADGHVLSMIASGISRASCYHRDAYEGGSAFLLLYDKLIDAQPFFDLQRLTHRYLDLISRYDVDHRKTLLSYLRIRGLPFSDKGLIIATELDTGERLGAEFDASGRLTKLNNETIAG